MITLQDVQTVYFDIDDTIAMLDSNPSKAVPHRDEDYITVDTGLWKETRLKHRGHCERLKRHKLRGHCVVVWSQAGTLWASSVVKAFGLEEYVDLVVQKPAVYYDDVSCEGYMGKPLFFAKEE